MITDRAQNSLSRLPITFDLKCARSVIVVERVERRHVAAYNEPFGPHGVAVLVHYRARNSFLLKNVPQFGHFDQCGRFKNQHHLKNDKGWSIPGNLGVTGFDDEKCGRDEK